MSESGSSEAPRYSTESAPSAGSAAESATVNDLDKLMELFQEPSEEPTERGAALEAQPSSAAEAPAHLAETALQAMPEATESSAPVPRPPRTPHRFYATHVHHSPQQPSVRQQHRRVSVGQQTAGDAAAAIITVGGNGESKATQIPVRQPDTEPTVVQQTTPEVTPPPVAATVPEVTPPPAPQNTTPEAVPVVPPAVTTQEAPRPQVTSDEVPAGEGALTEAEYFARRPKAQKGDILHGHDKYGRTIAYEATTGRRVSLADTLHNKVTSESDIRKYYREKADEQYEKTQSIATLEVEGKALIAKDERLKGLVGLGDELLALRSSVPKGKEPTPELQATLAAKAAIFKDLFELYKDKGLDERALRYIDATTWKRYEDPEYTPYKSTVTLRGEKVAVHDLIEDGDTKEYLVQDRHGERHQVSPDELDFKQNLETPKASRFERIRASFKRFIADWQEFGGTAALSDRWDNAKDWMINRNITPEMSPEAISEQKEKNRRSNMIGKGALIIGGIAAGAAATVWAGMAIHEHINSVDISGVGDALSPNTSVADHLTTDQFKEFKGIGVEAPVAPPSPEELAAASLAEAIQNPAYNIPDGGEGLKLFANLNLDAATWQAHAHELVERFPTEFYSQGGDVRIMNEGWLSPEARTFIEGLRG